MNSDEQNKKSQQVLDDKFDGNLDSKLKVFLRTHHSEVPLASDFEVKKIWRNISAQAEVPQKRIWLYSALVASVMGMVFLFGVFQNENSLQNISSEEIYLNTEWNELVNELNQDSDVDFVSLFGP